MAYCTALKRFSGHAEFGPVPAQDEQDIDDAPDDTAEREQTGHGPMTSPNGKSNTHIIIPSAFLPVDNSVVKMSEAGIHQEWTQDTVSKALTKMYAASSEFDRATQHLLHANHELPDTHEVSDSFQFQQREDEAKFSAQPLMHNRPDNLTYCMWTHI
ncbi:hypothetical protein PV04_02563 [Phialophora macrospora]|uniref:Uncharacterized protein n=1 Tax=Phialophora macrospora TaxID=1851006 RepID=A0A0D2FPN2_9EURO|nr:hypothetical protein PV04_02563 [Phialophora macrospora]